jgi:hypothetical protein
MNKAIFLKTAISAFILIFVAAGPVSAQMFDENVMLTSGQSSILSVAATKVLRHISGARADIHRNNLNSAKHELIKAQRMLAFINSVRPTEKVRDQIWVVGDQLAYKSAQEVAVNLIPIYASLDEISGMISVEKAKIHINKARGYLEQKNKKGAKQELEEADKALIFTEVDMPLASTEKYVKEAEGYLQKGNSKKADEALDAAEDGVQMISIGVYGPVAQANRGYWAASKKYVAGKYAAAKEDLASAKNYAQKSLSSADKEVKDKADNLLKDINDLEKKIESKIKEK